jgi:hypothetical protein
MTTDQAIDVRRARADLASTLNAIEDKLNVPRRVKRAVVVFRQDHPLAFGAAGLAAVAGVGAAVFFGISALRRR